MKKTGLSFLLLIAMVANGQPLISNIEKYTTAQGLSSNRINALLQDRRGYLWIATEWGLNRYDGRNFKQYTRTGINGLVHYAITSLAEDKHGNIWAGSNKGICQIDPLTETIRSWPRIGNIHADKEKNIWVMHHDSVYMFNEGIMQNKHILDVVPKVKNANRYIAHMIEDRRNNLWFTTSYGVQKMDKKTGAITVYTAPVINNVDPNACTMVYEDKAGIIWAGTWGDGILMVNETTGRLENTRLSGPYSNSIFGMTDIRLGDQDFLLLASSGTNGGLLLFKKEQRETSVKITKKVEQLGTDREPLSIHFNCILKDRQQNFWIGSADGLYKIDMSRQVFHWTYLPGIKQSNHVLFHSIRDIHHPDSIIYLSSIEGWWKMNIRDFSLQPHALPQKNKGLALFINRYVPAKNGWWFSSQQGFGFYDLQTNTITDHSGIMGAGKRIDRCWGLAQDRDGKLWISVYRDGLVVYDPLSKKTERLFSESSKDDLRGKSIYDLRADRSGMIWMVIPGTLYRINAADHSYKAFVIPDADNVPQLHISNNNRIFIYTEQALFEWKEGKIEKVFQEDMTILQFGEDGDGNFWLRTHNNFYRLSPDLKKMVSFTSGTGLNAGPEMSEMSFWNKQCIILSKGKLLSFNTGNIDYGVFPTQVMISSVTASNKKYFFPATGNKKIVAEHKDPLQIEIAALNLSNEGDNRIFYKLEGWEDQWKELITGSVISYEQLPPGNYNFQARATNGDRELADQPVSLHFRIDPPFWRTTWFIGLSIAIIVTIIYSLYRYQLAQVIKMERLRTRIATDLHDDIGATLSSISMYSEAVKKQVKEKMPQLEPVLEKMGENSRNMVSSMNDIVWAVNPDNDQGEKLLERMESYARDACSVSDSKLHFKSNNDLRQLSFSLEHRKNIYLVFKEALNNALKYSSADNIWVTIDKKASHFHLSIKDDGKGFDMLNGYSGNGLKNMQARAREIQAEITIVSALEQGTTIFLDSKVW